jgi:GNAT superfamily N-acetyltransferase
MHAASGPQVELATDRDMDEILSLLQLSFADIQRSSNEGRGPDFWRWKYRQSPFGPAIVQIIRIDGQVAAAGCLWPVQLRFGARILNALQPCDTAVHPAFRRRGLFGILNEARKVLARARGADLIFNFPNSNSLPGYQKSGWHHIGRVPWLIRALKPIAILRNRQYPGKSAPIKIPEPYQFDGPEASILQVDKFNPEGFISIDRLHGFWAWRFCQHPTRRYGLIRSSEDRNALAVFTLSRTPSGLIEMVVVDLLSKSKSISALLRSVLQAASTVGAGFIAIMKPQALPSGPFYRHAFLPIRSKNLAILPLGQDVPSLAGQIGRWDFRAAMHDSI